MPNENLPRLLREYEGEVIVGVWDGAWRMLTGNRVVVGSYDDLKRPRNARIVKGVTRSHVRRVRVRHEGCVLELEFDNDVVLQVVPHAGISDKDYCAYGVILRTESIGVYGGGLIWRMAEKRWRPSASEKRCRG
jgi:hypothetical protein